MVAISRSRTNIYIVDANTVPSTLTSTDLFKGDIKSYSKSGGEKDVESDPVFGGFVDKEKPISQVELSFEIVPLLDADKANRWDEIAYAKDLSVTSSDIYTMASDTSTQASDKMVVIEAIDGTNVKSVAYNNCNVTVLDMEHNADDNRTYNMTLKLSPTNGSGVTNFMTAKLAATGLPAWTSLDNNS